MKRNQSISKKKKWDALVKFVSEKFSNGEDLDLQAVLFLIGVNELGQGYRDFTKDEKVNLLHIVNSEHFLNTNFNVICHKCLLYMD